MSSAPPSVAPPATLLVATTCAHLAASSDADFAQRGTATSTIDDRSAHADGFLPIGRAAGGRFVHPRLSVSRTTETPAPSAPRFPTYRIQKARRAGVDAASYRHTLTVLDEHTKETLATCDLLGRPSTSELAIVEASDARCRLTPNRSVLPSRWMLTDAMGRVALQIDGKLAAKLLKPLNRTALALLEGSAEEPLRLVDTTSSLGDLVLGFNPGDWSLLRGEDAVAKLTLLPLHRPRTRGLRGWLRHALTPADRGLVSFGDRHVISAPAALAMVALFEEFTDVAG
jgi:hypothetical protein